MDRKNVLITGASSGIGFAAAHKLAQLGASVILVCRDQTRGAAAQREIAKVATGAPPELLLADLSSQAAIRTLAREVNQRFAHLDVLINNAAAMFARRELTVDGIEKTFAINHLAPFLLTHLLLDRLRAAPAGRIVTVTSESHSGALDFDNLQGERHYNFFAAYNRSKLGNVLFTYELARRLEGTRLTANCVSPGPTKTNFGSELTGLPSLFPKVVRMIPFLLVSPEKGAAMMVRMASDPALARVTGRFFQRSREGETKKITYNNSVAARLWRISDDLCANSEATSDGVRADEEIADDRIVNRDKVWAEGSSPGA